MKVAAPWSESELAYLREHYGKGQSTAIAVALGRTAGAVAQRASRIGLAVCSPWTEAESNQLRMMWGVHQVTEIATRMKRSSITICRRARMLGLGNGCPQGHEYLKAAARRTGYDQPTLRAILNWARVRIDRAFVDPRSAQKRAVRFPRMVVEPADVDAAIEKWNQTEYAGSAARRVGWDGEMLRAALLEALAAGDTRIPAPRVGRKWRVPSVVVDEIIAARKARGQVYAIAERAGITAPRLCQWLRDAGVPYSRSTGVNVDAAEAVIASRIHSVEARFRKPGLGKRTAATSLPSVKGMAA